MKSTYEEFRPVEDPHIGANEQMHCTTVDDMGVGAVAVELCLETKSRV